MIRRVPAVLLIPLLACSSGGGTAPPPGGVSCQASGLSVVPATANIAVGQTAPLVASISGTGCGGVTPNWTSSNNAIATVSSTGVVTGISVGGPVRIVATYGALADTSFVTVTPGGGGGGGGGLASIVVIPNPALISVGSTLQLTAIPRDAAGNVLVVPITWTSANVGVVSVSGTGVITGVSPGGPIPVTASSGSISGSTNVTVSGPSQTITITLQQDGITDTEGLARTFIFERDAALARSAVTLPLTGVQYCETFGYPESPDATCRLTITRGKVATIMATETGDINQFNHVNPSGQVDTVAGSRKLPVAFIDFLDPGSRCSNPERGVCVIQATSDATITVRYHRVPLVTLTGNGQSFFDFTYSLPKRLTVPDNQMPARDITGIQGGLASYGSDPSSNTSAHNNLPRVWQWLYLPPGTQLRWDGKDNIPANLMFKGWAGVCSGKSPCSIAVGAGAYTTWRYDVRAAWQWIRCGQPGQYTVLTTTGPIPPGCALMDPNP